MPLSRRLTADDLARTDAEREALDRVRAMTGEADGPMERHGVRCFLICRRLADRAGKRVDEEVLLVAGLLHDMGLYEGASRGGVYVTDGRRYAEAMLEGREGWPADRIRLCGEAIERHHELRSQWAAGTEVELMRQADLIEVSCGLVDHGAGRGWLRGLWRAVPRDGIYPEVARIVGRALLERPATVPKIFIRGRGR